MKSQAGFTLVEAAIGALLAGVASLLLFSIITAGPRSIIPLNHYDLALQSAASLAETLKNYVADAGADPAGAFAPNGSWKLDPNCSYALDTTCPQNPPWTLPPDLANRGGTIKYTVQDAGNGMLAATITVHWNEAQ